MVYKLPTLVTGSSLDDDKEDVSFSCFAKDFSPNKFEISWMKDGSKFTSQINEISSLTGNRKDTNGTILYSAASFLTVKSSEWTVFTTFTCVFEGKWGSNSSFKTHNVTYNDCGSKYPVAFSLKILHPYSIPSYSIFCFAEISDQHPFI